MCNHNNKKNEKGRRRRKKSMRKSKRKVNHENVKMINCRKMNRKMTKVRMRGRNK